MSRSHNLSARPENILWGNFEATPPPVLELESGDEIVIDRLPAATMPDLNWRIPPQDQPMWSGSDRVHFLGTAVRSAWRRMKEGAP